MYFGCVFRLFLPLDPIAGQAKSNPLGKVFELMSALEAKIAKEGDQGIDFGIHFYSGLFFLIPNLSVTRCSGAVYCVSFALALHSICRVFGLGCVTLARMQLLSAASRFDDQCPYSW